jgi:hypothetical protein
MRPRLPQQAAGFQSIYLTELPTVLAEVLIGLERQLSLPSGSAS